MLAFKISIIAPPKSIVIIVIIPINFPNSDGQSYLANISTYISGFSSYLPHSLKKQLPVNMGSNHPSGPSEERDIVVWASFEFIEIHGQR